MSLLSGLVDFQNIGEVESRRLPFFGGPLQAAAVWRGTTPGAGRGAPGKPSKPRDPCPNPDSSIISALM